GNFALNTAGSNIFNINNTNGASFAGVISGAVGTANVALIKTGTSAMTFSGSNTYTGQNVISQGTLAVTFITTTNDTTLGAVPTAFSAGDITLNGGTIGYRNTAASTMSSFRGITVGSNGGTIDVPTAQLTWSTAGGGITG